MTTIRRIRWWKNKTFFIVIIVMRLYIYKGYLHPKRLSYNHYKLVVHVTEYFPDLTKKLEDQA